MAGTGTATEIHRGWGPRKGVHPNASSGATTGRHTTANKPVHRHSFDCGHPCTKDVYVGAGEERKNCFRDHPAPAIVSYRPRKTGKKGVDHELINTGKTEGCLDEDLPQDMARAPVKSEWRGLAAEPFLAFFDPSFLTWRRAGNGRPLSGPIRLGTERTRAS